MIPRLPSGLPFLLTAALCALPALARTHAAPPFSANDLDAHVFSLARDYLAKFQHPDTGILYGARLSGKNTWTTPAEVNEEKPEPWGYGSRIADTALHTGHMLVAMLDACDAKPDPFLRDQIRTLFNAMKIIGSLPENYPKPGKPALEGLVPRGPHPDALSAYYDDSSMDQHTTYIISLALYANSPLATDADKEWIRDSLQKAGRRLEKNNWSILRADGVTQAHVGFSWKGLNSGHASILLPTVLALFHGTGDAHWRETYESFMTEKDGERWKQSHPGPHVQINGHPIYANQNAFRVNAWHHFESDPDRKSVLRDLLMQSVTLQLNRNFPGEFYRKYYSDDRWDRARRAFRWSNDELHGCAEAWNRFDPSMLDHEDANLAALAHVRFPLGGFHMVLLSENESLIREHIPAIWNMLRTVDLEKIDAGETHYLFTVVGLHLYAQCHRHPEWFSASVTTGGTANAYGRKLDIAHSAGTGPVMDVAVHGDHAYAIGRGALHVLDASDPAQPRPVAVLTGLGNTRQIVVGDAVAYVVSREDGLFVVDVRNPAQPRLLDHYDTVEFATGVTLSGNILFAACRNFGVELIDVSDPEHPRHLSTVRTGEAQSVAVRNGILYAGVWASSEIVVVDVVNPRTPRIVDRVPLDGYGDGLDVTGGYLYAATGHHSRSGPHQTPEDSGYGRGHGLEIFDLHDPAHPAFLSRVKFPPLYEMGNDMWGVTIANGYAFVADTYNGMFIVDISDPHHPAVTARLELPQVEGKKFPGFVGGLAPVNDHVYVAGGDSDLHIVALPGIARVPVVEPENAPAIAPPTPPGADQEDERWRAYRPDGQVYAVDFLPGDRAVVACGSAGVHLLALWPEFKRIAVLETEGFATDVCVSGDRVLIAEGEGGLSVCGISADRPHLTRIARYRVEGKPVRRVEVPSPGNYALVQAGSNRFLILDITDPASPKKVLEDARPGLLYGEQMMPQLVENRYACVFWHVSGLHWYDLVPGDGSPPVFSGDQYEQRIGSKNGLAVYRDKTLATVRGGFVLLDRDERRPLTELPVHRVGGTSGHLGTPIVHADRLYAADRSTGIVTVADITDPAAPELIEQFTTPGNPSRPVARNGALLIPDGYNGLLVLDP